MLDIEKLVHEKRMLLDTDLPGEGHEERFRHKLGRVPVRRVHVRHLLQVAASVAVILASTMVIIQQNKSGSKIAVQEIPPSLMEADQYYSLQVSQRYDQISQFDFQNEAEKAVLLDELNDLDAYHQQLINDLKANPDDEMVFNALIRHYQIKLEVMDQIIYQLNQLKTETEKKDEKESV
jgi:hypothetical protein